MALHQETDHNSQPESFPRMSLNLFQKITNKTNLIHVQSIIINRRAQCIMNSIMNLLTTIQIYGNKFVSFGKEK